MKSRSRDERRDTHARYFRGVCLTSIKFVNSDIKGKVFPMRNLASQHEDM